MPRPQWTVEQCRLYGRKGGLQRKGKKVRTEEYIAGFSAGYKAGRAERKRAGMTEKTKDQDIGLLGNTAGADSQSLTPRRDGVALIAAERARQIAAEGWTPEHDDAHVNGEMAEAATSYVLARSHGVNRRAMAEDFWPWENFWKPSADPIRNLVKAGALIAAEIDRLLRDEAQGSATSTECITEQTQKSHQP